MKQRDTVSSGYPLVLAVVGPTPIQQPSWQWVAGIPADSARDVPDVSLTAARHDPYLLCFEGSCQSGSAAAVFGTSAAAPSFAGIMALVREKTGSRLGQANYVLYRLAAAETLSQCNGSKTTALPASSCTFNDVTVGNNAVPGQTGYGTTPYPSTVGYPGQFSVSQCGQSGEQLELGCIQAYYHDSHAHPGDLRPRNGCQRERRRYTHQRKRSTNWRCIADYRRAFVGECHARRDILHAERWNGFHCFCWIAGWELQCYGSLRRRWNLCIQ